MDGNSRRLVQRCLFGALCDLFDLNLHIIPLTNVSELRSVSERFHHNLHRMDDRRLVCVFLVIFTFTGMVEVLQFLNVIPHRPTGPQMN
jgi:hypothetical protein